MLSVGITMQITFQYQNIDDRDYKNNILDSIIENNY